MLFRHGGARRDGYRRAGCCRTVVCTGGGKQRLAGVTVGLAPTAAFRPSVRFECDSGITRVASVVCQHASRRVCNTRINYIKVDFWDRSVTV